MRINDKQAQQHADRAVADIRYAAENSNVPMSEILAYVNAECGGDRTQPGQPPVEPDP